MLTQTDAALLGGFRLCGSVCVGSSIFVLTFSCEHASVQIDKKETRSDPDMIMTCIIAPPVLSRYSYEMISMKKS